MRTAKQLVSQLPTLSLPLDTDYLIVQTDGSELVWGGVLLRKRNKYDPKDTEETCRYASGKYKEKGRLTSLDFEMLAVGYALEAFFLYLCGKPEITLRTDCENIVKYVHQYKDMKKFNTNKRWVTFTDKILNQGLKINFEHISGKDNTHADILSGLLPTYDLLHYAGKHEQQKANEPSSQ